MPGPTSSTPMTVLVTGATGYVGSRLVPRLLEAGHTVRAAATNPAKAATRWWVDRVDLVTMDVLEPASVAAAVSGVDAVYYLIHGLGGADFAAVDRESADNLAAAADAAGVERLVYLSGLVPDVPHGELSRHITSRLEVERILTGSGIPTITLRAAIVTGSGSTSFEIVRQISERMPVQAIPRWMDSRVQPIAVTDVVEGLAGALTVDSASRLLRRRRTGADAVHHSARRLLPCRRAHPTSARRPRACRATSSEPSRASSPTSRERPSRRSSRACTTTWSATRSTGPTTCCPTATRCSGSRSPSGRALAEPDAGIPPAERDPLGPLPGDPSWAGGQGGGVTSAFAGARAVITGLAGKLLPSG